MRNLVKVPRWVIAVRCLSWRHRGVIAEGDLVRFGIKPGAPVAQFVKRLALPQMRQRQRDGAANNGQECRVMRAACNLLGINVRRAVAVFMLVLTSDTLLPGHVSAQEIDFDRINKFESLGTGTLHVGAPTKTIIDDGERHVVILTIWDADAETKVYWRSPDGNDARTTIIPGKGIQTFQTAGEFKLEAVGEPNREVNYGYVLLGLRK